MTDTASIWLPDAKFTRSAGVSLATTLYRTPLTISLSGELGAGKTTFLQGFLLGLGVDGHVVSPTYALEQRYQSDMGEILHIDLYRLDEQGAKNHLEQTEDHSGIRCIEWAERADFKGDIHIDLSEKDDGRELTVTFKDVRFPSEKEIQLWRDEVELPSHIQDHCDAVADNAVRMGHMLLERGILVRLELLRAGGRVHDLLRFVDFKPGAGHNRVDIADSPKWQEIQKQYEGLRHEPACAQWLRERGYPELASIVAVHGLRLPPKSNNTQEQKLLYYADKRTKFDEPVSLDERFRDFSERYTDGSMQQEGEIWYNEAKQLEKELFPDGAPE